MIKSASELSDHPRFAFDIKLQLLVAKLREAADSIEKNEVIAQRVCISSEATIEDYHLETLSVTFARKRTMGEYYVRPHVG